MAVVSLEAESTKFGLGEATARTYRVYRLVSIAFIAKNRWVRLTSAEWPASVAESL